MTNFVSDHREDCAKQVSCIKPVYEIIYRPGCTILVYFGCYIYHIYSKFKSKGLSFGGRKILWMPHITFIPSLNRKDCLLEAEKIGQISGSASGSSSVYPLARSTWNNRSNYKKTCVCLVFCVDS